MTLCDYHVSPFLYIAATGIQELHKLEVQLKSLHDQLCTNSEESVVSQEFQNGVDASYNQCFTVARIIKQEQLVLKNDNEKLTKDKSQLMNDNTRLLDENKHLKKQLAEAGKLIQ